MDLEQELTKALIFHEEMLKCPWFPNSRTKECNCQEYNRHPRILVFVNNKCPQHGLKEKTNESPQKSL